MGMMWCSARQMERFRIFSEPIPLTLSSLGSYRGELTSLRFLKEVTWQEKKHSTTTLNKGRRQKGNSPFAREEKKTTRTRNQQESTQRSVSRRGQKRDAGCKGENPNEAKALDSIKILVKSQPYQRGASEEAEKGKALEMSIYDKRIGNS